MYQINKVTALDKLNCDLYAIYTQKKMQIGNDSNVMFSKIPQVLEEDS